MRIREGQERCGEVDRRDGERGDGCESKQVFEDQNKSD